MLLCGLSSVPHHSFSSWERAKRKRPTPNPPLPLSPLQARVSLGWRRPWWQMGVGLFARAMERPLGRAGLVGAPVQPSRARLEQHAVDIHASVVAGVDVVRVGVCPSDRRLLGRLSLCYAGNHCHEQGYRNQQDNTPHKRSFLFSEVAGCTTGSLRPTR